jgi:hypothetical protein
LPEIVADIVLSSDDDDAAHLLELGASTMSKGPANDGTRVAGTASARTLIPGLIGTDAPNLPRPSVTDRVPIVPHA